MQSACSTLCALNIAKAKRERAQKVESKQQRKIDRERKEKLKTRADWMKEAQAALNRWVVHVRDKDKPCISCGRNHQGQYHGGHYRSRGSAPQLALEPLNIHKQCAPCNTHLHGNLIQYRVGLIDRIGLEAVEAIEADNTPRKYTIEELKAIKKKYSALARQLAKGA